MKPCTKIISMLLSLMMFISVFTGCKKDGEVNINEVNTNGIKPLAQEFVKVYESSNPKFLWSFSPGITCLENGRLVITMDLGGLAARTLPEYEGGGCVGKVFTSDDKGKTWTFRANFPFQQARPFAAGNSLYILGQSNDLEIIRSDDGGNTWSATQKLTSGQVWQQAPCNVHYANGNVYLVMERFCYGDIKRWPVNEIAPVLMRGKVDSDLTKKENWTFASELTFRDIVDNNKLDLFGIPFYTTPEKEDAVISPGRWCAPMGWLETNVVQFKDPNNYFYDPAQKTFHLFARTHTGGTGYGAICKVVENGDGTMTTMLEKVPSGKNILFVPLPGGQMKFHILYDEVTKLYWLLSTQSTDSMTRAEKLPPDRFNLPNNERDRLQLHFSKNCIDWCFAGIVATGNTPKEARNYASMAIDGEDLVVASRSGDKNAIDAHNTNLITFHRVKNFRSLVY